MNKYVLVSLSTLCTALATYHFLIKNRKKDLLTLDETIQIYESLFLTFKENSKQISRKDSYGDPHPRDYIDGQYLALYPKIEAAVLEKLEANKHKYEDSLYYYRNDARIKQIKRKFDILKKIIYNDKVSEFSLPDSMKQSVIIHILDSMKMKIPDIIVNVSQSLKEQGFSFADLNLDNFDPISNFFFLFREKYEREALIDILKTDGYTLENYYDAIELYSYQDDFSTMLKQEIGDYEETFNTHFSHFKLSEVELPENLTPDKVLEIDQKIINSYEASLGSAIKRLLKDKLLSKDAVIRLFARSDIDFITQFSNYINKEPYVNEDDFESKYGVTVSQYLAALSRYQKDEDFAGKYRAIDKQKGDIVQAFIGKFFLGA